MNVFSHNTLFIFSYLDQWKFMGIIIEKVGNGVPYPYFLHTSIGLLHLPLINYWVETKYAGMRGWLGDCFAEGEEGEHHEFEVLHSEGDAYDGDAENKTPSQV